MDPRIQLALGLIGIIASLTLILWLISGVIADRRAKEANAADAWGGDDAYLAAMCASARAQRLNPTTNEGE